MRVLQSFFVVVGMLVSASCAVDSTEEHRTSDEGVAVASQMTWTLLEEDALSEAQRAQLALGREAQSALAQGLMTALTGAMDEGGPTSAIAVCHDEALKITAEQTAASGVRLGRTSAQLRNPANIAPNWAREFVDQSNGNVRILVSSDGRLGVLTPIKLKAQCGMCHGPVEEIAEEVLAEISTRYPEDRAVGFNEGDVRGWFWFEVPSRDTV